MSANNKTYDINDISPLTFRDITVDDDLQEIVEKTNFNFDQVLQFTDKDFSNYLVNQVVLSIVSGNYTSITNNSNNPFVNGNQGDGETLTIQWIGKPGATGDKGNDGIGRDGSQIYTINSAIDNSSSILNPNHKENDIIVDGTSMISKVVKIADDNGNDKLIYINQFKLNQSNHMMMISEKDYFSDGVETDHYVIFDKEDINKGSKDLIFATKEDSASHFYRLSVGIDGQIGNEMVASFNIANIPVETNDREEDGGMLNQLMLKYRKNWVSKLSPEYSYFNYKENIVSNEVKDQTLQIFNSSVGGMTVKSYIIDKHKNTIFNTSRNVRFQGNNSTLDDDINNDNYAFLLIRTDNGNEKPPSAVEISPNPTSAKENLIYSNGVLRFKTSNPNIISFDSVTVFNQQVTFKNPIFLEKLSTFNGESKFVGNVIMNGHVVIEKKSVDDKSTFTVFKNSSFTDVTANNLSIAESIKIDGRTYVKEICAIDYISSKDSGIFEISSKVNFRNEVIIKEISATTVNVDSELNVGDSAKIPTLKTLNITVIAENEEQAKKIAINVDSNMNIGGKVVISNIVGNETNDLLVVGGILNCYSIKTSQNSSFAGITSFANTSNSGYVESVSIKTKTIEFDARGATSTTARKIDVLSDIKFIELSTFSKLSTFEGGLSTSTINHISGRDLMEIGSASSKTKISFRSTEILFDDSAELKIGNGVIYSSKNLNKYDKELRSSFMVFQCTPKDVVDRMNKLIYFNVEDKNGNNIYSDKEFLTVVTNSDENGFTGFEVIMFNDKVSYVDFNVAKDAVFTIAKSKILTEANIENLGYIKKNLQLVIKNITSSDDNVMEDINNKKVNFHKNDIVLQIEDFGIQSFDTNDPNSANYYLARNGQWTITKGVPSYPAGDPSYNMIISTTKKDELGNTRNDHQWMNSYDIFGKDVNYNLENNGKLLKMGASGRVSFGSVRELPPVITSPNIPYWKMIAKENEKYVWDYDPNTPLYLQSDLSLGVNKNSFQTDSGSSNYVIMVMNGVVHLTVDTLVRNYGNTPMRIPLYLAPLNALFDTSQSNLGSISFLVHNYQSYSLTLNVPCDNRSSGSVNGIVYSNVFMNGQSASESSHYSISWIPRSDVHELRKYISGVTDDLQNYLDSQGKDVTDDLQSHLDKLEK